MYSLKEQNVVSSPTLQVQWNPSKPEPQSTAIPSKPDKCLGAEFSASIFIV